MENNMILVVGGAGYIGSHMVQALLAAGHGVVTLDNLSRGHRDLLPGGEFIEGDLADRVLLDQIFSHYPIVAVMHFAACSLVGESVMKPLDYYRNNVSKTVDLLDSMVRNGIKYFIFSSTAAVYGDPQETPIRETHPCNPVNPYGASKYAVERLLDHCDRAYALRSVTLRYFNAAGADVSAELGERHHPETHLIPLVLQVASGQRSNVEIYGCDYPTPDGTCLRDYIHVNDLAHAHLLALQSLISGAPSAVYNLGNSRGYSVHEVIELARRITGHPIPAKVSARRSGDPAVLIAASDKARAELGWRPRFERLEDIIRTAWAWHEKEAGAAGRKAASDSGLLDRRIT